MVVRLPVAMMGVADRNDLPAMHRAAVGMVVGMWVVVGVWMLVGVRMIVGVWMLVGMRMIIGVRMLVGVAGLVLMTVCRIDGRRRRITPA